MILGNSPIEYIGLLERKLVSPISPSTWNLDPHVTAWLMIVAASAILSYFAIKILNVLVRGSGSKPDGGGLWDRLGRTFVSYSASFLCFLLVSCLTLSVSSPIKFSGSHKHAGDEAQKVWATRRSGFYYCPGLKQYGVLQPGRFMTESGALQAGYRSFSRKLCR